MESRQAEAVVAAISRSDADLATKQDLAILKADIWRIGISIAGGAVVLNKFLDWVIK